MTFKFIVQQNPLSIEFEAGSVSEGVGILQQEGTALAAALTSMRESYLAAGGDMPAHLPTATEEVKRRGRPPKNASAPATPVAPPIPAPVAASAPPPMPAPVAASAPPPMPAPVAASAPPPAPVPAGPIDTTETKIEGVPNFLVRDTVTVAPPPPAPPPLPAPDVRFVTAQKVVAELRSRAATAADKGQALADWVVACGYVQKGATFEEAMTVLQFQGEDKIAPIAKALSIS